MAAPTTQPAQPVNYEALLASDPVLQTALGQINQASGQQQGALTAARQQDLIGYGAVPQSFDSGLVGNVAADITPAVGQEAQQATRAGVSTVAQLARAYNGAQQGSTADLAARGMLHSGAYRQHSLENLGNYQAAQAGAQTDLLGKLAGALGTYTSGQQALAGQAQTATGDATARLLTQIANGYIASPTTASTTPAAAAGGGSPLQRATVGSFSDLIPKPTAANFNAPTPRLRSPAAPANRKPLP